MPRLSEIGWRPPPTVGARPSRETAPGAAPSPRRGAITSGASVFLAILDRSAPIVSHGSSSSSLGDGHAKLVIVGGPHFLSSTTSAIGAGVTVTTPASGYTALRGSALTGLVVTRFILVCHRLSPPETMWLSAGIERRPRGRPALCQSPSRTGSGSTPRSRLALYTLMPRSAQRTCLALRGESA